MRRAIPCLSVLAFFASACGAEPPKPAAEPKAEVDTWANLETSPEWLHATRDALATHEAECAKALGWIRGEAKCAGAVCSHARDLAKEWLAKCEGVSKAVAEVKPLKATFGERALATPSPCAKTHAALLHTGCKAKGDACLDEAQAWATKCAEEVASPLAFRMLERKVETSYDEPGKVTLDPRGCEELRADVVAGATCDHRFKCEEALEKSAPYRERCQGENAWPTIATAVLEVATLVGAEKPVKPMDVMLQPKTIPQGGVPLGLTDGSGAALWVCDGRPKDVAAYVDARTACGGGRVSFARAFDVKGRYEVRAGFLDAPSDAVFAARFPSLVVHGEGKLRDERAAAAITAAVGATATDLAAVVKVLAPLAPLLRTESAARAALAKADEPLAPIAKALGKAKADAAKGKLAALDLAGFVARARTSPFADVDAAGAVVPGTFGPLAELPLEALGPVARAAYLEGLTPMGKAAKTAKPKDADLAAVRAFGEQQAQACADAMKAVGKAEQALLACGFGFATCDADKVAQLAKSSDDARAIVDDARGKVLAAASALGSSRVALVEAAAAAGCTATWW